jgi:hypothetical protein
VISETAVPELRFAVHEAAPLDHAAVPTLAFPLTVVTAGGSEIRSMVLRADLRIALGRRAHDTATRHRLSELFGTPAQWDQAPRSLPWTVVTTVVPSFEGEITVPLHVTCTYDFEVTATKYFHALPDGLVPLDFLFTGSVFYAGADGRLRTARIPWDREAAGSLPTATWKALMQRYFADTTWLRLRRDAFDRLWEYRARHALPSWEDTLARLLREPGRLDAWTR